MMVLRLYAFIFFFGICPLIGVGAWIYRVRAPRRLEAQRKMQGLIRASHTCYGCLDSVNTDSLDTIYEDGHWWHRNCRNKLIT